MSVEKEVVDLIKTADMTDIVRLLVKHAGMRRIIEELIDGLEGYTDDYVVQLKDGLQTAFDNYEARYEQEDETAGLCVECHVSEPMDGKNMCCTCYFGDNIGTACEYPCPFPDCENYDENVG